MSGPNMPAVVLSSDRVAQLVGQYAAHRGGEEHPDRCVVCGARWPCWYREDARVQLAAVGEVVTP